MRGLRALLRVKQVAEERALRALSAARCEHDRILVEEGMLRENAARARTSLRTLEKGSFDVRRSILYRRFIIHVVPVIQLA